MKRKSSKRLRGEEKPADDIEKDYMAKDTESINKEFSKKFSSQKRLRINQSLTSKLHILTNAEQKFAAVLTPGRITGAKNNNLWDFKIASLQHESSPGSGTASLMSSVLNTSVLPAVERLRHRCVTESRDHLKQLCKDHDIIPPLMAWERWQANSMLQEQLRRSSDSDSNSSSCYDTVTFKSTSNNYSRKVRSPQYIVDDILPSDVKHIDRGLVQDLQRGGIREEKDAVKIALDLVIHSKKLIDKIQSFSRSCIPIKDVELRGNKKKQRQQLHQMNQAIADADLQPTIVNHKHTYDVYLGCKSKHIIKLNTAHYRKLRELFLLVHRSTSNHTVSAACSNLIVDSSTNALNSPTSVGVEGTDMGQDEVTKAFHAGLYSMLARYNALLGHGMQCALPEHVFEILHDHVKTNFECFASPLNCRYFSYCSAFPDTDAIFGSKGSFFDFFPTSGSYEVNPPFIESIMAEAVNHAHSLLSVSIDALSFVFIVPGETMLDDRYSITQSASTFTASTL